MLCSASGRPRSSRTHENTKVRYDTRCYFNVRSKADVSQLNLPHGGRFSLNKAIDRWLREFFWSSWLKEDMMNNIVSTKAALYYMCQTFLQLVVWRSYRSCLQTIFYTCLFGVYIFRSNSLSKISKFIDFTFSKKFCLVSCFQKFLLQKLETL